MKFDLEKVNNYKGRTMQGTVVSVGADKTIKVRIDNLVKHKLYGKFMRKTTHFLAHDEKNECKLEDVVTIKEGRPISKRKSWVLVNILERAS